MHHLTATMPCAMQPLPHFTATKWGQAALITSEDQGPVDLIVSTSEVSQDPSRLVAQSHLQPVHLEKQVSVSVLNFSALHYFFIEVCTAPQSI